LDRLHCFRRVVAVERGAVEEWRRKREAVEAGAAAGVLVVDAGLGLPAGRRATRSTRVRDTAPTGHMEEWCEVGQWEELLLLQH
jgi:hypothetical protein